MGSSARTAGCVCVCAVHTVTTCAATAAFHQDAGEEGQTGLMGREMSKGALLGSLSLFFLCLAPPLFLSSVMMET